MPRIMDGSRRSRLMCSGCGRPRPALWTGLVIFGWMAVFLLACLMFSWPMPLGIRDESSASLLYDLRGEVRVPEAESEVIVVEEVLEGAQSTIDRPPDKYEGDGESRQDDIVERTASSEQTSVPDVVEGQGHNGGGTRYVVRTHFKSAHLAYHMYLPSLSLRHVCFVLMTPVPMRTYYVLHTRGCPASPYCIDAAEQAASDFRGKMGFGWQST